MIEQEKILDKVRKPPNYWNKERCYQAALLCGTKTEFKKNYVSAYNNAWEFGWLDEFSSHMKSLGNIKKRLVYCYEFSNKSVYVGLTSCENKRHNSHLFLDEKSPVYKHMKKFNITPVKEILSDGYIDVKKAQILEGKYLTEYKNNNWNILNKNKAGGLGGNIIYWTKERCKLVARKCTTRNEFAKNFNSAYISCRKNKWLDDVCKHMIKLRKPHNYWNYGTCKNVALECNSRFEFSRKYSRAHVVSLNNNWLDEFFSKQK